MTKEELNSSMKKWLRLHDDEVISISECFDLSQKANPFHAKAFCVHFAPLMVKVITNE